MLEQKIASGVDVEKQIPEDKVVKDTRMVRGMPVIGIDASNIRSGGGVTHLVELLNAANPEKHDFMRVIVWAGKATLSKIAEKPWLRKVYCTALEKGLLCRTAWQRVTLSQQARNVGCNVLLVPGGTYTGSFFPVVAMSQNLLPFQWGELKRFGWSLMRCKLTILHWTQSRTLRRSQGAIFLTHYARDVVRDAIQGCSGETQIVPHGISSRFFHQPDPKTVLRKYTKREPCRIVYVSIVDMYKHQWQVARAVAKLRDEGLAVRLDLVGPAYPPALKLLKQTMQSVDPDGETIHYVGPVSHDQIQDYYAKADICVFASSCENLPNILIEGMASGVSMACSNRGPMPEVLGDAGCYFDPEEPRDIARAIRELIVAPGLRLSLAQKAYERASAYSWERCASETFAFIGEIAQGYRNERENQLHEDNPN